MAAPAAAATVAIPRLRVCIVGASGKLGNYMIARALEAGHDVVGVCRPGSVPKIPAVLAARIRIVPGATNDRDVIRDAVAGCDGVLTVLVPWGDRAAHYSSGTAQAVLDFAPRAARLVFSCGWHISRDGLDQYSRVWRARAVRVCVCLRASAHLGSRSTRDAVAAFVAVTGIQVHGGLLFMARARDTHGRPRRPGGGVSAHL